MLKSSVGEQKAEEPFDRLGKQERRVWVNLAKVLLTLPGALESQLLRDSDLTLLGYMILARLSVVPRDRRLRAARLLLDAQRPPPAAIGSFPMT